MGFNQRFPNLLTFKPSHLLLPPRLGWPFPPFTAIGLPLSPCDRVVIRVCMSHENNHS